jgi:hypothetical protein
MKEDKFKITVEFTVYAEAIGPWDSEACAVDFIRHRIDESRYLLEDNIREWKIMDVKKIQDA